MKVLTTELDEVGVDGFTSLRNASSFRSVGELIIDDDFLLGQEKIGDLTRVEQIVDVFEEGLEDDLSVREQELRWLVLQSTRA